MTTPIHGHALDDSFFEKAELRVPQDKEALTASVDPEILDWFRAQGAEYQQRINAALRLYVEAHRREGI